MARIRGPRKVSRYTAEFKLKAVKLSQIDGVGVQDVADALEIHPFMLSRWRKQAREGRIVTKGVEVEKDVAAELRALRRMKKDYERLKLEHELLKKAIEFTSQQRARSSNSSKPRSTRSRFAESSD
jgi:transposase